MGHLQAHTFPVIFLSEGYLLANQIEDAIRLAGQALDFARDHKLRPHQAWALQALGEIASHRDPPDTEKAEASYRQAMVLADELGMRPLVAHCHLGLGKLYGHEGSVRKPVNISRPLRRCTARWTCDSGLSRRRSVAKHEAA